MTQYNILNIKLSNQQLNKLKLGRKNGSEVTWKLLSTVVGDSNDDNNFLHKLLLTDTYLSNLCKALANGSSDDIKCQFYLTQLYKIVQGIKTIS